MFLEQLTYTGDIKADTKLKFLNEKYAPSEEISNYFIDLIKKLKPL